MFIYTVRLCCMPQNFSSYYYIKHHIYRTDRLYCLFPSFHISNYPKLFLPLAFVKIELTLNHRKSTYFILLYRGSKRDDVVYLGWPKAPSYMSPNAGGGGGLRGLSQWIQLCTWSLNKLWKSNSIFNLCLYRTKAMTSASNWTIGVSL